MHEKSLTSNLASLSYRIFGKIYYMWLTEYTKKLSEQNQRHKKLLTAILINELQQKEKIIVKTICTNSSLNCSFMFWQN